MNTSVRTGLLMMVLGAGVFVAGCNSPSNAQLGAMRRSYQAGDYAGTYNTAKGYAYGNDRNSQEAAYMAGLAAYRLKNIPAAEDQLRRAAASSDRQLSGDALAILGMLYYDTSRYNPAITTLMEAADKISGEDKARAYFYTALSQQKLGRWTQARTNFSLARSSTRDAAMRNLIAQEMAVTGFTLQLGAYSSQANAQNAAQLVSYRVNEVKLGHPRIVTASDAQKRPIYLVQAGQFSTWANALDARAKLGRDEAIIVPLAQ